MPSKKNLLIYLIFFLLFFVAIYLGYLYSRQTEKQQTNDPTVTERQFDGLKTKEEEIDWESLLVKAIEDCKPVEIFKSQEARDDYLYNLSKEMLEKLDVEKDINLSFKTKRVPRTSACWTIWMGNNEGVGFGGYKTTSDEIAAYSIKLSKEEFESI